MIIFYNKKTGQIFHYMEGRVHDKKQLAMEVFDSATPKEDIGKFIIGWEETDKILKENVVEEQMVDQVLFDGSGRKVKAKVRKNIRVTRERREMKEHNLDHMELLQDFESISPTLPFHYKVIKNKLVKAKI